MEGVNERKQRFCSVIATSSRVCQAWLLRRRCDCSGPNLEWTSAFSLFVPDTSSAFPSEITHLRIPSHITHSLIVFIPQTTHYYMLRRKVGYVLEPKSAFSRSLTLSLSIVRYFVIHVLHEKKTKPLLN